MKTLLNKINRLFNQLLGFFPSPIPVGITEFNAWIDSFFNTYDLPTKDRDSVAFTVATMIIHSGPTNAYKSKFSFLLALRASAAKQIASQTFQDIKLRHMEAQRLAAEAAKTPEVTDTAAVASDETKSV